MHSPTFPRRRCGRGPRAGLRLDRLHQRPRRQRLSVREQRRASRRLSSNQIPPSLRPSGAARLSTKYSRRCRATVPGDLRAGERRGFADVQRKVCRGGAAGRTAQAVVPTSKRRSWRKLRRRSKRRRPSERRSSRKAEAERFQRRHQARAERSGAGAEGGRTPDLPTTRPRRPSGISHSATWRSAPRPP